MNKIRVFEAFAGYGSQAMAAKRLKRDFPDKVDFDFVGISEIKPTAIKAYNAVHGEIENYGDISTINWEEVPDFDLFTYSFPCTDISNAGKQMGFSEESGTRSSLLWECEKAIAAKRPKYLLMENVKALIQKKFMVDFQRWIDLLDGYGYTSFWQVLNVKDFGIPQNRERVFMISTLRTEEQPEPRYNFPKGFSLEKCVEDYMVDAEDIDENYFIDQERVTNKVLSDILDQSNVRAEIEQLYHEEWKERLSDSI
ncbi:MAG: DNA (cytosine-5-)-methyltransferase [Muribaculaceae bacterium]|nr:DNA (cytosine-5-)-methyltransferase [Muribaculaceae bacterium]